MSTVGRIALALLYAGGCSASAQDWSLRAPPTTCSDPGPSEPAASYRVSGQCELADITVLGAYTGGSGEVLREIRGFRTQTVERALVDGRSVYFREVRIELHRLLEPTAVLVCRLEMLRPHVIEARIERPAGPADRGVRKRIEPLSISAGRLPDLGVYTHGISLNAEWDCP